MNSKLLNLIMILFILVIGISYMRSASVLGIGTTDNIGAGFYPFLLADVLLILTIISLIQTIRKKGNERIEFPNSKLILFTIGVIALFILSWSLIGFFYINLFFFFLILYSVYSERLKKQFIFKNSILSLMITISVFIIFNWVLKLPL